MLYSETAVQIKTTLLGACIFKSILAFEIKRTFVLPGQTLKMVDAAASVGVEETPALLSYIIERICALTKEFRTELIY